MSYASATHIKRSAIPVIDIGPLRDGSDPEAVAAALRRAAVEVGFLYVCQPRHRWRPHREDPRGRPAVLRLARRREAGGQGQ